MEQHNKPPEVEVEVQLLADREQAEHAACLVKNWFETQEQRFSRFVADSELNRLNESQGWISVSAAMDEVLSLAYGYIGQTEGIFQPGIMKALRSSGYDTSFEGRKRLNGIKLLFLSSLYPPWHI